MRNRPSGDQLLTKAPLVPVLMTDSSRPAPLESLSKSSKVPERFDENATRRPSGDHVGAKSIAESNVNLDQFLWTASISHTSVPSAASRRCTATCWLSGESARFSCSALVPIVPSRWPLRSNHVNCVEGDPMLPAYASALGDVENVASPVACPDPTCSATGLAVPVSCDVLTSNGCARSVPSRTNSR